MASSPLFENLELHAVFVGEDNERHRVMLANAHQHVSESGRSLTTSILHGATDPVIAELMDSADDTMLMMGEYGRSPRRNLNSIERRVGEASVLPVRSRGPPYI